MPDSFLGVLVVFFGSFLGVLVVFFGSFLGVLVVFLRIAEPRKVQFGYMSPSLHVAALLRLSVRCLG